MEERTRSKNLHLNKKENCFLLPVVYFIFCNCIVELMLIGTLLGKNKNILSKSRSNTDTAQRNSNKAVLNLNNT